MACHPKWAAEPTSLSCRVCLDFAQRIADHCLSMKSGHPIWLAILSAAVILCAGNAAADPLTILVIKWKALLNHGSFQCKYTQEEVSDAMTIHRTGSMQWQLPKFRLTEEMLTQHSGGREERHLDVFVYDGTRYIRFQDNEFLMLSKREEAQSLFRYNNNPLTFLFQFLHENTGRALPFNGYRKGQTYLNFLKKLRDIRPAAEGRGFRFKVTVEDKNYEVELDPEFIPSHWTCEWTDADGTGSSEFRVLDRAPAKIQGGSEVSFPSRYELVHRRDGKVVRTTTGTISDVVIGEAIPETQFSIDKATAKTVIDLDEGAKLDTR